MTATLFAFRELCGVEGTVQAERAVLTKGWSPGGVGRIRGPVVREAGLGLEAAGKSIVGHSETDECRSQVCVPEGSLVAMWTWADMLSSTWQRACATASRTGKVTEI